MRMRGMAMSDRILASALLATLVTAASAGQPATSATTQPVSEQVRRLGNENYKVRERAQQELIQLGLPAKEEVAKAAQSDDAEVKSRASVILGEIARNGLQANNAAIAKKVQWSFKLDGGIVEGPVLAEGVLWALGDDGKLRGADPASGQEVCQAELAAPPLFGANFLSAASNKVLVRDGKGAICAFAGKSGKLAWKFEPPGVAAAAGTGKAPMTMPAARPAALPVPAAKANLMPFRLGMLGASLAASDELVAVWNDGTLTALSLKDGQRLWESDVANAVSRPAIGGGKVFLTCADANANLELLAFDAAGGKLLWKSPVDSGNCPLYHDGMLLLTSGYQVKALDAKEGKPQWQKTVGEGGGQRQVGGIAGNFVINGRVITTGSTMLQLGAKDGILYVSDGETLTAMKVTDGSSVWTGKFPPAEQDDAAIDNQAVNAQRIVINNRAGAVRIFRNGALVRSGRVGARPEDALLIGESLVLVPDVDGVSAFDLNTGTHFWSFQAGMAIFGAPLLDKGVLYLGTGGAASMRVAGPAGMQVSRPVSTEEKVQADAKPSLSAGLHALKVN